MPNQIKAIVIKDAFNPSYCIAGASIDLSVLQTAMDISVLLSFNRRNRGSQSKWLDSKGIFGVVHLILLRLMVGLSPALAGQVG